MVSGLAITHVPLKLMLRRTLMINSTGFRIGGNENAASIIQSVGVEDPTCRTKYGVGCETCERGATRTDLVLTSCDPSRSSRLFRVVIRR